MESKKPGFKVGLNLMPWNISPYLIIFVVWAPMILTMVGAFVSGLYTLGALNISALIYFLHAIPEDDYFLEAPHVCEIDDVRIPVASPLESCTVYILPSEGHGFEAAFSRKVLSEHKIIDTDLAALEPLGEGKWTLDACRAAMNKAVLARIGTVAMSNPDKNNQLRDLARWLYEPGDYSPLGLKVPRNKNLIGREVVMALLHWERLVFERRWLLDDILRKKVWRLRCPSHGGAVPYKGEDPEFPVVGSGPGIKGLKEAVAYVYKILPSEEKVGDNFPSPLPYPTSAGTSQPSWITDTPCVSGINPNTTTLDEYAGDLWEACWKADQSTFGALYLWTAAWYMDLGNAYNVHIAPLQPPEKPEYMTNWRMRWRHSWNTAVICQLIILLPTILNNLFAMAGS